MLKVRLKARPISQFVSIGTPRPLRFHHLTAGLLARGYAPFHLPSHGDPQWPGALTPREWTAIRLQLRGQPRSWSLLGLPHRVPY
jgi:hypothetical protein